MWYDTKDLTNGEIYLDLISTTDADKKRKYVPAYHFSINRVSDKAVMGIIDLRIGHNELTYYGGNIGYQVLPPYFGHRYASQACKLLLSLAKKHDMKYVVITCATDNLASQKTAEYAGFNFVSDELVPKWHNLYQDGQHITKRYIVNL